MNSLSTKVLFLLSVLVITAFNVAQAQHFYTCGDLHYLREHREGHEKYNKFTKFSYDNRAKNGPPRWLGACNNGIRQSPIVYDQIDPIKKSCNVLEMGGAFNVLPKEVYVLNNGHTAVYSFTYRNKDVPQISGGPLGNDTFDFSSFHYHYPCEHFAAAEKKKCQLEVHFVHFNNKYKNIEEASNKVDGLAVVSLLYEISEGAKPLPFVPILKQALEFDDSHHETRNVFTYAQALGFTEFPAFVSYKGSLTTPGCTESVTWIVIDQLLGVSYTDLRRLRLIEGEDGKPIKFNNRPVQPLNGRKTFYYNEF